MKMKIAKYKMTILSKKFVRIKIINYKNYCDVFLFGTCRNCFILQSNSKLFDIS